MVDRLCVRCGWTEVDHGNGATTFTTAEGRTVLCPRYEAPAPRLLQLVNRALGHR